MGFFVRGIPFFMLTFAAKLLTNSKHLINILLMKKIFTLIAMALMAVGANAQEEPL